MQAVGFVCVCVIMQVHVCMHITIHSKSKNLNQPKTVYNTQVFSKMTWLFPLDVTKWSKMVDRVFIGCLLLMFQHQPRTFVAVDLLMYLQYLFILHELLWWNSVCVFFCVFIFSPQISSAEPQNLIKKWFWCTAKRNKFFRVFVRLLCVLLSSFMRLNNSGIWGENEYCSVCLHLAIEVCA